MSPHDECFRPTRRRLLAGAAAVLAGAATGGGAASRAVCAGPASSASAGAATATFEPVVIPGWVFEVSRMAFATPDQAEEAARAGAQVLHTNLVWPYYPLRRDGGGLSAADSGALTRLVANCRRLGLRLVLGLPPFPPVALVKAHPEWRVHPEDSPRVLDVEPREDNLGTRLGCNLGPWGGYLIDVCVELAEDFGLDGFSFDGNYHPPICYCPACQSAWQLSGNARLPPAVNLDDLEYRKYLAWRGEKLEDHYRRMQRRLKQARPEAVLMSWTVNAGRYGHFLHSPRAMPTRLNLLFDLPMQEWWLDETNLGASLAPAFGAAYLRATTHERPNASEPYLMARGNPYGTESFPRHERLVRSLLVVAQGGQPPQSLGWPGGAAAAGEVFDAVRLRERWYQGAKWLPWAAILVSEQTRQFYAWRNIAERWLPHVLGAFRCACEEHLPVALLNDWNVTPEELSRFAVVMLPSSAALSDAQVAALRDYVANGGGLVATCEASLCDELGSPRGNFALAELFGVSYLGRPQAPLVRPALDANFVVALDESYWSARAGVARLAWGDHALTRDQRLAELCPNRQAVFKGPQVLVSEPEDETVVCRMTPEGWTSPPVPAMVARRHGKGRVVYLATACDAALWSYAYPYQRRLLCRSLEWAAARPVPMRVEAPMCVQASYFERRDEAGPQTIIHLFNGLDTTANHGLPASDVPLREEAVPVAGIRVRFATWVPRECRLEPEGIALPIARDGATSTVDVPPLGVHALLVAR